MECPVPMSDGDDMKLGIVRLRDHIDSGESDITTETEPRRSCHRRSHKQIGMVRQKVNWTPHASAMLWRLRPLWQRVPRVVLQIPPKIDLQTGPRLFPSVQPLLF